MRILKRTALVLTMAISLAGLQASVTEHQPPAPLPEFKTPEQLAKWRSETAARTANQESTSSRPSTLDSSTPFYTGKPYLADSGSYAFKYREYNPEMGRWTTVDPSGFPDGANNVAYMAVPTSEVDICGLRASAAALWSAYPNYSTTSTADVWAMAGGWLQQNFLAGDHNYYNSCALRLSIALNGSGNAIPKGTKGASICESNRYIISASSMLDYVSAEWGAADEKLSEGGLADLKGKLDNGKIAVVINGGHVGIVTKDYADQYTPYAYSGAMSVWILE
jgi:RHS repeat-associated protein